MSNELVNYDDFVIQSIVDDTDSSENQVGKIEGNNSGTDLNDIPEIDLVNENGELNDKEIEETKKVVEKVVEEEEEEEEVSNENVENIIEEGVEELGFRDLYEDILSHFGYEKDEKDNYEDSIDGAKAFIENLIKEESKNVFANDELYNINEFVKNGGSIEDYIQSMSNQSTLENYDVSTQDNQANIVYHYLKSTNPNKSETWIEQKINRYIDAGTLEDEAIDALEDLKVIEQESIKNRMEEQKRKAEIAEQQKQEYINGLRTHLLESNDLSGFKLENKKAKEELFDYVMKPGKDGMTEFQKALNDVDKLFTIALLAKQNFNIDKIKKMAQTEVTRKMKKTLSRYKDTGASNKGSMVAKQTSKDNFDDFVNIF